MEIIIDCESPLIGLDVVRNELNILKDIAEEHQLKVDKFVLTAKISQNVNEFYGVGSYQETRNVGKDNITVLAKYCTNEEERVLFLSSSIFEHQDASVRLFILLHELMHLYNGKRIIDPPVPKIPGDFRLSMLYHLFDEYSADRFAFNCIDLIFPEKSYYWEAYNLSILKGFGDILLDPSNSLYLKEKINMFRNRKISVDEYLEQTRQRISDLSITTVHLYASLHNNSNQSMSLNLEDSRFVNQRSDTLVNYLRTKFESSDTDIGDGFEIITAYLTNFGILLQERESSLYCYVVDI